MYRYILVLFLLSFTYASAWSEVPTFGDVGRQRHTLVPMSHIWFMGKALRRRFKET